MFLVSSGRFSRCRGLTFRELESTGAWYLRDEEVDFPPGMWLLMCLPLSRDLTAVVLVFSAKFFDPLVVDRISPSEMKCHAVRTPSLPSTTKMIMLCRTAWRSVIRLIMKALAIYSCLCPLSVMATARWSCSSWSALHLPCSVSVGG